jgi:DNA mismatch repair protein MLH1
MFYNNL